MRLVDADEIVYDIRDDEGTMVVTAEDIAKMPTVDAEPIRHGKWIYIDDGGERYATYRCSHCHQEVTVDAERICDIGFVVEDLKYCPNCGARMMEEVTE